MNDKFIIAVGSSAGGLASMKSFFEYTPHNHATYIILRHIPIDHRSELHLILKRHSKLQIVEAMNATRIEEDIVYIPPASMYMTIENNRLLLKQRSQYGTKVNTVIDVFFTSLAEAVGRNSIGVVLSGSGTDGVKGAAAIKAAGGMVMTQTPESCLHNSMPKHTIEDGLADHILDPTDMPSVIRTHIDERLVAMRQDKNGRMA